VRRTDITQIKLVLAILAIVVLLGSACNSGGVSTATPEPGGNQPPVITDIAARHMFVDPQGYSELKCIASDPDGDQLSFEWLTTDGSFDGTGATVIWQAPNSYGDYHIMVIVKDINGASTKDTLTIGVITRTGSSCCGK